ncbi:TRI16 protein, partial [Polypterus senegalus]|nr:tripartite motif-containing protein 16-like [Polypterus senegalus]MBN3289207.1 TRI16 protein [Polypterus senegalus]
MAAPQLSVSADQYSCSVCLEVLNEPVTIPCGHSYCMDCINDYWDKSDTTTDFRCPQCRRSFSVRPELNRNTVLRDLIEKLKKVTAGGGSSESYAGPDDVSCDFCTGRKLRAVKTCLTCMASYCETHLRPHLESDAFKRHRLEEPTGNLEKQLCTKHQKVLEIFCRTDETCLCVMCAVTEHNGHDMMTPEQERFRKENQLEESKEEMRRKTEEKEKKMEKTKDTIVRVQSWADSEVQGHEETFKSALQSIEMLRSEATEVIRGHERRVVSKAKEVIKQLEEEIKELKRRGVEMAELSQTDNHIHFLIKFPSVCLSVGDQDTPDVSVNGDLLPEAFRMSLSELKKSLQEISGWELVKTSEAGVDDSIHTLQNLRTRNGLLKYFCPLTLDPNTAHRCLELSEGSKKVTCEGTEITFPDHPDRFDCWPQVLCSEALSGTRWYWEVEWSGDEAEIGVAYKGIGRKGGSNECLLGGNSQSWCLYYCDSSYSVWHNNELTQISAPCSHRIGVYLDWPAGSLSFYSVSDTMTLLHKINASFTEPLYAGFWVDDGSSVTICNLSTSDK